ncbi:DUF1854 domain-containing protein [Variovorax terrae]|uniref:DUF1854 domain-containing protein n=1 Tax=Variovorax terrae TaxID=2923278 RepID=A0A9X1VW36_9BURK|nr:DUF1854 domain-containing protein [Variovorax terrae]MCJ0764457.1 DUF1854 domain-containing protein [Variovorax terrae]
MTPMPLSPVPAFELERDAFGRLVFVAAHGERHIGVVPVRAFPIAAPDEGISIVGADGHELIWIDRLDALPGPLQALLREEFAQREFVPEIRRLKQVSTFSTPSIWEVETDRGDARFVLHAEEDIRRVGRFALLIVGSQGVQFSVRDMSALDRGSRRLIERFL